MQNKLSIENIYNKLLSSKSIDRKKAAKEIGARKIYSLGEALLKAYIKEINNKSNSWETQVEMIISLGIIRYEKSITELKKIIIQNKSNDMVTYAAGQSYVRIIRSSLFDAIPVIELINRGSLSLADGALYALGVDKMKPPPTQMRELISLCWNLHQHKDRIGKEFALCDPRYGLVLACKSSDFKLTYEFLIHCKQTSGKDERINQALDKILNSKKYKSWISSI